MPASTSFMSSLMATEVCTYTLSYGGKPVGSQLLRTTVGADEVALEARLLLQGALGQHSVTQTSLLSPTDLRSARFSELTESRDGRRAFEVAFDAKSGLVRAVRRVGAQSDAADTPYVRPYSDPLGLLYTLRQSVAEDAAEDALPATTRVPMLGKDVLVERLPPTEVETALGVRRAWALILSPGPSYVYIDIAPPHLIVRLTQRLEEGLLDAFLVRVAHEAPPARERGPSDARVRSRERPDPGPPVTGEHEPGPRSARRRRRGGRRRRKETP